jgi:levansucrase
VKTACATTGATAWLPSHVRAIATDAAHTIPLVDPAALVPLVPGLDLWDLWPLQLADGALALIDGWALWFVLSAPRLDDPDLRHDVARIRLMRERDGAWQDCGDALPDGLNPGSREWAGSAVFDPASGAVTLFYTVTGRPGEASATFEQRLFQTTGKLQTGAALPRVADWSTPIESVRADGGHYMVVDQQQGVPGMIKGFRDPAHFRDPVGCADYLLFTGSLAQSVSTFNGCVGIAKSGNSEFGAWQLLPPLLIADGLNNEQERPHLIHRDGRYYLFWSTQRHVFAPDGPSGPSGLYGMVADSLLGPYEPLNGTGLVAANPDNAPLQAYSWWVTDTLEVVGFADLPGVGPGDREPTAAWRRAHFGGVPAPRFRIALDGSRAWVQA